MRTTAEAWRFLARSEPLVSADEVQAALARLAGEISAALAEAYPLALAVMGGAVVFAGQLLPRLHFPLDFDYIHVSRYGDATRGGAIAWRVAPPETVRGRVVLVLDDILDGGQTLCAVRERVLAAGAAAVRIAVLVEKRLPKPKPVNADFVGLYIPDRFVFGFGLDARGYWRNLPEIRALTED